MMDDLITELPARKVIAFAEVEHGGTGRFDLIVHRPNGTIRRVAASLSRGQANAAADSINETLAEWLHP